MMSEVACEPELPPELMMSGMNSASTTARLDLVLEVPHRRGREHLAEEQRARASPRASGSSGRRPISMYGSSSASMPPNFCTSSVCSRDDRVDHVVHRDDAEHAAVASSTHRHGEQVVLGDQPGDVLAIGPRTRP